MGEVPQRYRELILFTGWDDSAKTSMLFDFAQHHPENKFRMMDFENKTAKIHAAYYPQVTNIEFDIIMTLEDLRLAFEKAKANLKAGDGLLIDGVGRAWDMIQTTYDPNNKEHGPDMWRFCKGQHNKLWMDIATGIAPFHVIATALAAPNEDININRERDEHVQENLMRWKAFGFRPDGEKRNTGRFDTVFALKSTVNPTKFYISTYKDKARPPIGDNTRSLWTELEFPFWPMYERVCAEAKVEDERIILPQ